MVVALAMVAVFGAMSLADPAQAAIGQPADSQLAERTFSPQDDTLMLYSGLGVEYDLAARPRKG